MKLIVRKLAVFGPHAFGGQAVPFGTERFETDTNRVVALGRFGSFGDAVSRLLVKLDTGEVAQVAYRDQSDESARWLRARARRWKAMPRTSRELPWGTVWEA